MRYLLHHLISESALTHPDAIAVVDGDRSISYGELERRSNQLARLLIELGVRRGDRVGLYLEKSLESIIGLYGVLKAGSAYVPFDPNAPTARLAYIAGNCEIRTLLTGTEKATAWVELTRAGAPIEAFVVLNADASDLDSPQGTRLYDRAAIASQLDTAPAMRTIGLDLAYILYTSGSTGVPKGVMLSHRNALSFVDWAVDEFRVGSDDRLSSHAPLHFDLSIFDIFAAGEAGARVVLVPASASVFPVEVARFIEGNGITIWYSVPSVLSMLVRHGGLAGGEFQSLRTVLFAGEVFPTKYLRRLMNLLPHVEFANLYGPTETNVCTYYRVPPIPEDQNEAIPIGRAIADVEVFAVTDDGLVAAPGEEGELYVRGSTVMLGYWADAERTARGLFPNPFGGELRDPVYRTGDLVREDPDGNYRFFGRRDAQIKSRGYRIELGEIEGALYAHPAVVECAVTAIPDELITNRIKVYVVTRVPVEKGELIRFCAERIPRYMIPELWAFPEVLPKTSTGKVDRQALMAGVT